MKINKIICTVGLPGSGKSRFAKQFRNTPGYIVKHLDTERIGTVWDIDENTTIVLDGFMRSDLDIMNFVRQLIQAIKKDIDEIGTLEIHVWEVDRKACRLNAIRRGRPCTATIDKGVIRTINPDFIRTNIGIKINSCISIEEKVYTGHVGERLFEFGDFIKAGKIQPDLNELFEFYKCEKSVNEVLELLGLDEGDDIRTGELFLLLEKLGCDISRPYKTNKK